MGSAFLLPFLEDRLKLRDHLEVLRATGRAFDLDQGLEVETTAADAEHVEVEREPCRAMHGCGSASNQDELDAGAVEGAKKCGEIGHDRRASAPARRSSSANRWSSIRFSKRSSTERRRFSRIDVRSTPC